VVEPHGSLPTQNPSDDRDHRGACAIVETSVPSGWSDGRGRAVWSAIVRYRQTRGVAKRRTQIDTRNSFALRHRVSEKSDPWGRAECEV